MKPWPQPDEKAMFPLDKWTVENLVQRLGELAKKCRDQQKNTPKQPRRRLTEAGRQKILSRTDSRCHLCGGSIDPDYHWEVDHVYPHSLGGVDETSNCLPSHGLCNSFHLDFLPEQMQWMLKIGLWARKEMEEGSKEHSRLGREMLDAFVKHQKQTEGRKKQYKQSPAAKAAGA